MPAISADSLDDLPITVSDDTEVLKCSTPFENFVLPCVGGTLGIPKAQIKLLALHSLYIFHSVFYQCQPESSQKTQLELLLEKDLLNDILKSSLVILATITEHLPAINIRKAALEHYRQTDRKEFERLAKLDLLWTGVLFSSPLPKHNKSPILWTHRQWVVQMMYPSEGEEEHVEGNAKTTKIDLKKEYKIIFAAADQHRNNYYCYSYARWLTRRYLFNTQYTYLAPTESSASSLLSDNISNIHWFIYTSLLNFAKSHVSDISAWTFLLHFLLGVPENLDFLVDGFVTGGNAKQTAARREYEAAMKSKATEGKTIKDPQKYMLPERITKFLELPLLENTSKRRDKTQDNADNSKNQSLAGTHYQLLVDTLELTKLFDEVVPGHESVQYFLRTTKSIIELKNAPTNSQ